MRTSAVDHLVFFCCRYVMLFASILPWAAPLTLIYTLAKIKQVSTACSPTRRVRHDFDLLALGLKCCYAISSACYAVPLGKRRVAPCVYKPAQHHLYSFLNWHLNLCCRCGCCNLQDCMSLLLVYQRPMPRQMRNLGSWNTVLLVQVRWGHVTSAAAHLLAPCSTVLSLASFMQAAYAYQLCLPRLSTQPAFANKLSHSVSY